MNSLEFMLNWLESEGFFLWYNDKTNEWSIFPGEEFEGDLPENVYSLTGADKNRVIEQAFHTLAH